MIIQNLWNIYQQMWNVYVLLLADCILYMYMLYLFLVEGIYAL